MTNKLTKVMPSATPTEAEIEAWNELSREEQLKRLREVLSSAEASTTSDETVADIVERARKSVAEGRVS